LADKVAEGPRASNKTLGKTKLPTMHVDTLELKNIMNEIVPMYKWHFRSAHDLNLASSSRK
jgi:hypothetical protein